MTTPREPDRLIRAFLDEGRTELPDRSYDAVRAGIDRTRQRVVIGPWREPRMNNITKLAIAAAAVLVVAVVGVNLLSSGRGGGAGSSGGAPSASAPPGPTTSPEGLIPTEGLGSGSYTRTMGGLPVTFTVTTQRPGDGWTRYGGLYISKPIAGPQDADGVIYFTPYPNGTDARLCPGLLSMPVGSSAADLAAIVAKAPGTQVVIGPAAVTVGGRPAQHVELTVRHDLGCDPGYFYTWNQPGNGPSWWVTRSDDTIDVWIVDVDGTRLFIAGEIHDSSSYSVSGPFPSAGPAYQGALADLHREVQGIVDSISFP
jgi:hypothetical protein